MNAGDLTPWIIIGVVILAVVVALIMVGRRINRQKEAFDEDRDLFGQDEFGDDGFGASDDFASIRINQDDEREPSISLFDDQPLDDQTEVFASENENVVPLRSPETEQEAQPMTRVEEPAVQREPMVASADAGQDYAFGGQAEPQETSWGRGFDEQYASRGHSDDTSGAIAPVIRDYLEESERRQQSRIEDLRDDVRRQLSGVRDEQSSRLDLFLNSIDRKISSGVGAAAAPRGGDEEDHAATRRRIDGLNTLIERVSQAVDRQGERLSELSRSMEQRLAEVSPVRGDLRSVHDDVLGFRREVEANTMAVGQMREDFDKLKEDFGRMERSFLERAQSDQSVSMRLADVVRGTLSKEEYQLNAKLSNGHTADCVIFLKGRRSQVAIDGRFPIESFNKLPSRDAVRRNMPQAKAGEDEFRRTVLRSIFACADRCIIAGETADSAILFLPSEAAYTILHDRFPDLVRDSHRARVWLTSPSTLMGTLNLLHNMAPTEEAEPVTLSLSTEEALIQEELEGPFYSGPSLKSEEEERAEELEDKLRALREQERMIAEELTRTRQAADTGRRRSAEPASQDERDFEQRLERFSFDIDQGRIDYDLDSDERPLGFRGNKGDDDLR